MSETRQAFPQALAGPAALERVLDTLPIGIVVLDVHGRIQLANAYMRERAERIGIDLVGLAFDSPVWSLGSPTGEPVTPQQLPFAEVMRTGQPLHLEGVQLWAGAQSATVNLHATPWRAPTGEIDCVVVAFEDVTARVHAERDVEAHARELAFLSDAAMRFVQSAPDDDIYRHIGEEVRRIVGDLVVVVARLDAEQAFRVEYLGGLDRALDGVIRALGRHPRDLRIQAHPDVLAAITRGRLTRLDFGIHEITGGLIPKPIAVTLQALTGFGAIYVIGLTRPRGLRGTVAVLTPPDVAVRNVPLLEAYVNQAAVALERHQSERRAREIEEQLIQSQKLEAIGTLAGGLAHDFNNLLSVVVASASLLRIKLPPGTDLARHAQMIENEAQRGSDLVRQLLGFARKDRISRAAVDVHVVVQDVIAMLGHTLDRSIKIFNDARSEPAVVLGDAGQLAQVLLNLAVNARDAMPSGGELRFATAVVELDETASLKHRSLVPGRHVVVRVSDTGAGIPAATLGRIFEPFFTTKKPGRGSGMGLSTSYGIVKRHAGAIEVESIEGYGSTFSVYLPLSEGERASSRPADAPAPSRGSGRVLVVDDEPSVCEVLSGMLTALGYRTEVSYSGEEAIAYYREHGQATDLVILDLKMTGMDGGECLRQLRQLRPDARVLISSGHIDPDTRAELMEAGARGCLPKPYNLHQLSEAVVDALG